MTDTTQPITTDAASASPAAGGQAPQGSQPAPVGSPANGAAAAPAGGEAKPAEGEQPKGAPAEYADFTFADGLELDSDALSSLKATAKELGLSQEAAQKFATLGAEMAARWGDQAAAEFKAAREQWQKDFRADPDFGGDKTDASLAIADRAMKAFGGKDYDAVKDLFDKTGLGDHPLVLRLLVNAGKAVSDDGYVPGGTTGQSGKPKPFFDNSDHN